jgi:hypothetical protein
MTTDEEQTATITYIAEDNAATLGIDPGYYFHDDEYPDEGAAGPFDSIDDAIEAAVEAGYVPVIPWMRVPLNGAQD